MAGFYEPDFATKTNQWEWLKQPRFPVIADQNYDGQLVARTAGDAVYVQDLGTVKKSFRLNWKNLTTADKDAAKTFFNAIKRAFKTFEYRDINGVLTTVRWVNRFNFQEDSQGRWSGSVDLKEE